MPTRIKTAPKVFGTAMLVKGNCLLFREIRLKLLGIGKTLTCLELTETIPRAMLKTLSLKLGGGGAGL